MPPPAGFEPTISAGERPHTYFLDLAATGIGKRKYTRVVRKLSGHFEYLENRSHGLDVTW